MKSRIGIFVIAYNAEATLSATLNRIPASIVAKVDEIFVIDDCSTDNTSAVGRSYGTAPAADKLTVHRNPANLMYGGNQKRGYRYAIERGLDIVVLLHADGQYAPEVMHELLDPIESGRAEMVMGSRMITRGAARKGGMPMYKYFGNRVLTTVQNGLLGTRFSEFHSGYRAYSCRALASLNLERLTNNWHFDTQVILEFLERGYRIAEVPIPTYYGDEICRVNGIPYAYRCVRTTFQHAWRTRRKSSVALRTTQRSSE